ncbi:MAG: ATP-binding protein, partial [Flavitalea sp.]
KEFHEHERPVTIIRNGKRDLLYANFVFRPHYDEENKLTGILAVANEVTAQVLARKKIAQAEETTRLAVDAAHLGSYEINLETGDVNASARCNQIFGINSSVNREDYFNALHPDDIEARNEAHDVAFETGDLEYEARVIWQDGTIHWIRVSGRILYDIRHSPIRLLGIVQDITEQKTHSLEQTDKISARTKELELANAQLARSNAELEQFAYVTSHDLQEPLRKIQMFSSILIGKSKSNEGALEYTRKISDSAKRMTSLITDLLDYSRLSQHDPAFSKIDLNKTIRNISLDFELLIEQKKGAINCGTLAVVPGIPAQINQLFYNLIGNALKFAEPGRPPVINITGGLLTTSKRAQHPELDQSKDYFEVNVSDNGIGFEQQYAERIFVVFQRLNVSPDYSGHGIGLAICSKIIANHNGVIYAKSSPGEGAVFTVILPLVS